MTPQQATLYESVDNLIKAKGRFHTEQNYAALVVAFDAETASRRAPAHTSEPGARDAVLEEAAAACDALESDLFDQYKGRGKHDKYNPGRANPEVNGQSDGAGQCAVAIRALKRATPASPTTVCAPNCFYGDCPPCVEAGIAPASPAVPAAPLAPSLSEFETNLRAAQKPLDADFSRILHANLADMYVYDDPAPSVPMQKLDYTNYAAPITMSNSADPAPLVAQACPKPDKFTCSDRAQCWEPCGELGHSAEHARGVQVAQASPNRYSYRKRPVVIEAFQFQRRNNGLIPYPDWYDDAVTRNDIITRNTGKWHDPTTPAYCEIKTLEGVMRADEGDWIIRGVKGEMYPCKPDIFALSYEPAAPEASPLVEDAQLSGNSGELVEDAQRIVAGKVESADKIDAERYRWLRDSPADTSPFTADGAVWVVKYHHKPGTIPSLQSGGKGEVLDRNVDEARATTGNATADDGKDK